MSLIVETQLHTSALPGELAPRVEKRVGDLITGRSGPSGLRC